MPYDPFESDQLRRAIEANTNAILRLVALFEAQKDQRVYSNKETARLIGRCEDTVGTYLKQGKLKRVVVNGCYGIPQSEIDKYIELHKK